VHTVHAHELVVEVRRVDIEVVTTHDLPMVVPLVPAPQPIQEDVEPDLVLLQLTEIGHHSVDGAPVRRAAVTEPKQDLDRAAIHPLKTVDDIAPDRPLRAEDVDQLSWQPVGERSQHGVLVQ